MAERQLEPVALAQPLRQPVELTARQIGDPTAHLADRRDRPLAHPAVHRRAVSEMGMLDHPGALELVERPVDGGRIDARVPLHEISRSDAVGLVVQAHEERALGRGEPTSVGADALERLIETDGFRPLGCLRDGHGP